MTPITCRQNQWRAKSLYQLPLLSVVKWDQKVRRFDITMDVTFIVEELQSSAHFKMVSNEQDGKL